MSVTIWIIIAAVVCAIGVVVFRSRKDDEPVERPVGEVVPGLAEQIGYNRTCMTHAEACRYARAMRLVLNTVWPQYEAIYGKTPSPFLRSISLDPKYQDDEHPGGIELKRSTARITFNPTVIWGKDYDFRNTFAGELHTLFRYRLHGMAYTYETRNPKDALCAAEATLVWQRL